MVGEGLSPAGRLFCALVPPAEVVVALSERLGPLPIPGRLVPPVNWHITLRFVGEVGAVTYERWVAALDQITMAALPVRLDRLGAFPHARSATVLWVGIHAPGIDDLATAIEDASQSAGIAPEERPFRPHLTLARARPPADVRALVDNADLGRGLAWRADTFHVMAAVGGRYKIYETFGIK